MINYKFVQKKSSKIPLGYTLIELLVTLTIVGLLFGFGFVNFRDFSRRQELQGAVKEVQVDLRLAQSNAITGQKPVGCSAALTLDSYSFYITSTNPASYQLLANCGTTPIDVKDVSLPADISFSSFNLNPIKFKALGQGTNITSGSATIILKQVGGGTATVSVTMGGQIQ